MTGLKFWTHVLFSLCMLTCPGSHQAHGMAQWILTERERITGIVDKVM